MEYILSTNSLTKQYKGVKVVNSVNMHIRKGDVYGFVGENGAGKTTIIRLLTGLANPSGGDFDLFGVNSKTGDISTIKRKMAAVVESPSIYLNMSAYDNLVLQCRLLGIKDFSIIPDVLEQVGLSDVLNDKKSAGRFSLGMRQRLGIAMALIGNPEFIILDEPMNGLDPEGIIGIRELIIKLNTEKGITFLISSHILDELQKVATTFGFIHKGELIRELTVEQLHEECRKCIEIVVENVDYTLKVLEELEEINSYKVLQNGTIRIYDEITVNALVKILDTKNIMIKKFNSNDENIEEFYLNMIRGGVNNA